MAKPKKSKKTAPKKRAVAKRKPAAKKKGAAAKRRTRKMPAALKARFAAWAAAHRPMVNVGGKRLVATKGTGKARSYHHTAKSKKISDAVRAAIRAVAKNAKHGQVHLARGKKARASLDGAKVSAARARKLAAAARKAARSSTFDVRFNPSFASLRKAFARSKKAFKGSLKRSEKMERRHVEVDGVVMKPGSQRIAAIKAAMAATGGKHGMIKWNPVRDHAEGLRVMRMAAAYKRKHGVKKKRFVTKGGRVRTVQAAELRMQGKRVNTSTGHFRNKQGRKILLSGGSSKREAGGAGYDPLKELGQA